jgi:hypothetical protein
MCSGLLQRLPFSFGPHLLNCRVMQEQIPVSQLGGLLSQDGTPDHRRCGHAADAIPLRAMWLEPDVRHGLRNCAHCACSGRSQGHC